MVKRIVISAAALLLFGISAHAGMTNVFREMFSAQTSYGNASPGSLGYIQYGNLYQRSVGPRTNSVAAPGYSALSNGEQFGSFWSLSGTYASTNGCMGAWVRFSDYGDGNGGSIPVVMALSVNTNSTPYLEVGIGNDGAWKMIHSVYGNTTGPAFNLHTWYYLMLEWNRNATSMFWNVTTTDLSGNQVTVYTTNRTTVTQQQYAHIRNSQNNFSGGTTRRWYGRIGAAGLYNITGIGSGIVPTDIVSPVESPATWYVNPTTGSDSNSGASSGAPWLTITNLNQQLFNGTVLGAYRPWLSNGTAVTSFTKADFLSGQRAGTISPNGDVVKFDTSGGPMYLDTMLSEVNKTPGLTVTSANAAQADIRAFKVISSGTWSKTASYTNTYQTTDTELYSVLWENRKWLNKAYGANWAAVANTVDATPGYFWTDGTTMYAHPFGDTNPGSDGKTYERTRLLGGSGNDAIFISGGNVTLTNLSIGGTALADTATTTLPGNHYCIELRNNFNAVQNCYLYYGSKHTLGIIEGTSSAACYLSGVQMEQGTPYCAAGGQTLFVHYTAGSLTNMASYLFGCWTVKNEGLIGSTAGKVNIDMPVFYCHNNGGAAEYADSFIEACNFSLSPIQSTPVVSNGITVTNSVFGFAILSKASVNNCYANYGPILSGAGGVLATNCIITPVEAFTSGGKAMYAASGTLSLVNCTLDTTGTIGNVSASMFNRVGAVTFLIRNCVLKFNKTGEQLMFMGGATNTDTLTFVNNVWATGTSNRVMGSYSGLGDQTFAQWQVLGKDVGSVNQNPCLGPGYRPYAKTPTWNTGTNLGALTDYTRKTYQARRTAGAYEYAPPISFVRGTLW